MLQQVSFDAPDQRGETLTVNAKYVKEQLTAVLKDDDLRDYIL